MRSFLLKHSQLASFIKALLAITFPIFLAFSMEYINFYSRQKTIDFITGRGTPIFIFSAIVCAGIFFAFTMILRRAWLSSLIVGIVLVSLSGASYFKNQIIGTPLLPWDLFMAGDLKEVTTMAKIVPTFQIYFSLIGVLIYFLLFLLLKTRPPLKARFSIPIGIAILACIYFVYTSPSLRTSLFENMLGIQIDDTLFQNKNYEENGFFGGFSINVGNLVIRAPLEYSKETMEKLVRQFPATPADPDFQSPDVIVILSEAFWDPEKLPDTQFSADPISNFRRIRDDGIGGMVTVPTFGGGTVRTEIEMLTGISTRDLPEGSLPYQQYIKKSFYSFPSYFRSIGYKTVALHTYYKYFYGRDKAYPLMGFDEFIGLEDFKNPPTKAGLVTDDFFMDRIIDQLEKPRENDQPLFLFGISMENHGPYNDKFKDFDIDVTNSEFDEEAQNLVDNFTQGVYDADKNLGKLIKYLKQSDRPTVLLYFGDHLPTLGAYYKAYYQSGYINARDASKWNDSELVKMFSTPALIWSNKLKLKGDIGNISAYFWIPQLLLEIGAPRTSFQNFLLEYNKSINAYTSFLLTDKDGNVLKKPSGELQKLADIHYLYIYDLMFGDSYQLSSK